ATETVSRCAGACRADPDGIVVDHRRLIGRAAHVPLARLRLAVDPGPDALRLAELVRHGDMVPTPAGSEAVVGGPAVPVRIGGGAWLALGGKQKAHARFAALLADSQGPVLVVAGKAGRGGASLADDVHVFTGANLAHLHPGFQRDRIAVGEV